MNKTSLEGKVAIVTGAGSGIGRASATLLAERGARVVVADLDQAGGKETVGAIGGSAIFVPVDVADEDSVNELIRQTLSTYGRLDIAHNNAGINLGGNEVADSTKTDWDRVIAVNLTGTFLAVRAEIPAMLATGGGSIINMSSIASSVKGLPNRFVYGATKAGVIGLTKSVAIDFVARGIRCNCICPGTVETPSLEDRIAAQGDRETALKAFVARQPIGRLGRPEEVAALAVFLASDEAAFTTGTA
ncbi:MAG: SDR family NAD(P)-dependent oxidoreductase, partial [Myxococcota bacterium]